MDGLIHAYWIANNICSNCKKGIHGWAIQNGYEFCPYCGAKMDDIRNKERPLKITEKRYPLQDPNYSD